jgi:hypothetical protein
MLRYLIFLFFKIFGKLIDVKEFFFSILVISVMSDISDICDIDRRSRDESELTLRFGPSQQYHLKSV